MLLPYRCHGGFQRDAFADDRFVTASGGSAFVYATQ
jgi:hypothetical protein